VRAAAAVPSVDRPRQRRAKVGDDLGDGALLHAFGHGLIA
jgi:hypothetical protein